MLLPDVEYARPRSLDEALMLLRPEGARALAGGQTLVNVLKLRIVSPDILVDITRLPELRGIHRSPDGSLEIGAAMTYAEIAEADDVWMTRPVVAKVASIIADVQVRNRGTIGGNACLNLPTNHFPTLLAALDAEMDIVGGQETRTVSARSFFDAPFSTAVQQGELLTKIRIPQRGRGVGDAFVAMAAGKESQSIVHVAVSLRSSKTVEAAAIFIGCVGPRPIRASDVERALVGTEGGDSAVAAVQGLGDLLTPIGDVNATADFKRHVAEVLTERAIREAVREAEAS